MRASGLSWYGSYLRERSEHKRRVGEAKGRK
jgi:hypothetical protein